jgi:tetratricopeptide (TPR) repeat protein
MNDGEAIEAAVAQVKALLAAGDRVAAAAQAQAATAAGLDHPLLLNLTALALERAGRLEESEIALRRALALDPRDLGALHALGLRLLQQERFVDASEMFRQVVDIRPDVAPAHANRAAALEGMGLMQEAEQAYLRALDLKPDLLTALLGRARLLLRRGKPDEACSLARKVLLAHPGLPDAVLILAEGEIALRKLETAVQRVQPIIASPASDPPQRALALGLMADALDRLDRPSEAFAVYSQANDVLMTHYRPRFGLGESLTDFAAALARWAQATPPRPTPAPKAPDAADRPSAHVFLLGFPRSGTTLLEQVLGSHPSVVALEERDTLIEGALRFLTSGGAGLDRLAQAQEADLEDLRAAYWRHVHQEGVAVGGKLFLDKHPLNTLKLPLIARLFPTARVLFAIRDPRDVVLSCFRRRFRMNNAMYQFLSLDGATELYAHTVNAGLTLRPKLGLAWRDVVHETLVADFDGEVADICSFLGLYWDEALRDFATRAQRSGTPSAPQVARGLNREGVGYWRRYAEQLAPIAPRLRPFVERFGYSA